MYHIGPFFHHQKSNQTFVKNNCENLTRPVGKSLNNIHNLTYLLGPDDDDTLFEKNTRLSSSLLRLLLPRCEHLMHKLKLFLHSSQFNKLAKKSQ